LTLFRQQASIISSKKEALIQKLEETTKRHAMLHVKKETGSAQALNGDDFKRYVSELRGKATTFKLKKSEMASLIVEQGVLSRTDEVLIGHEKVLQGKIEQREASAGVGGFNAVQDKLEMVSEKKTETDQTKGKTLEEISEIIQKLVTKINVECL
jgi:intraflagellar transport protein 81